jgi:antigen 43
VGTDWWAWGNLAGQFPDGTLNANGSLNAAQLAVYSQLQMNNGISAPPPTPTPIATTVTTGTGPDQLMLAVSEDALENGDSTTDTAGDATFAVSVDGMQLGGTFTATASHAAKADQDFVCNGSFGTGSHTVQVTFLNDATNAAGGDRNLYIDDVRYLGKDTGRSAALYSSSTQSFIIAGGTATEACFAEGTMIATPDGEVRVEQLAIDQLVDTLNGPKQVKWVGYRSIDISTLREPDSARLVRICRHTFAENVPHRDLLVTQDHRIFIDGGLIPARMLVNKRNILIDQHVTRFTYYHVELEQHGILLAEWLPTESYLDTGNRSNFGSAPCVSMVPNLRMQVRNKTWAEDAAAPLTVDHAVMGPIWVSLDRRADQLRFAHVVKPELITDPDLRLVTGAGSVIHPTLFDGSVHTFLVPGGTRTLRLIPRTSRPSDTIGPFCDDRRLLGVQVGEIGISDCHQSIERRVIDRHISAGGSLAGMLMRRLRRAVGPTATPCCRSMSPATGCFRFLWISRSSQQLLTSPTDESRMWIA